MVDVEVLLLALEDVLPVLFSAIGLWVLSRVVLLQDKTSGNYATTGFVLITTGGITKPTYKMILALSGGDVDITWLDDALFWFLAPGFLVLAAGLRRALRLDRGLPVGGGRWGVVTAVIVVTAALGTASLGSDAWFIILLTAATVGNVLAIAWLIKWARAHSDRLAGALFAGNLILVFGLAGAAAALEQTIATQWGEQLVSTAAQAMFMWASFRLAAAVTSRRSQRFSGS